jgi:hypothetical protein
LQKIVIYKMPKMVVNMVLTLMLQIFLLAPQPCNVTGNHQAISMTKRYSFLEKPGQPDKREEIIATPRTKGNSRFIRNPHPKAQAQCVNAHFTHKLANFDDNIEYTTMANSATANGGSGGKASNSTYSFLVQMSVIAPAVGLPRVTFSMF